MHIAQELIPSQPWLAPSINPGRSATAKDSGRTGYEPYQIWNNCRKVVGTEFLYLGNITKMLIYRRVEPTKPTSAKIFKFFVFVPDLVLHFLISGAGFFFGVANGYFHVHHILHEGYNKLLTILQSSDFFSLGITHSCPLKVHGQLKSSAPLPCIPFVVISLLARLGFEMTIVTEVHKGYVSLRLQRKQRCHHVLHHRYGPPLGRHGEATMPSPPLPTLTLILAVSKKHTHILFSLQKGLEIPVY